MDEQIIERAVDAAARGAYEHEIRAKQPHQPEYDWLFDGEKDEWTRQVRAGVIAALAEVEGAIKAQALREYADAGRHPWTVFLRADGTPVTVNDLMRETADRLEAGEQ